MDAIVFDRFGDPGVLRLTETEEPHAGPGQVRVKVRAAGVNPVDCKIRAGLLEHVFPTSPPAVPGIEFAGVVDETGEGVTGYAAGDEVFGWTTTGAYAAYALATDITAKPAALSWEEAAALPVASEAARRVLGLLGVREGETLLLHGAAGAVGAVAVQLAVSRGATVVGTASPAHHDRLRALGAVPLTYGDGLAERVRAVAPRGVDAVFDAAGRGVLPVSIELRGGRTDRIVTLADPAAADLGVTFSTGGTARPQDRLAEDARLVADGALRLTVAQTFAPAQAAKAHELSESGRAGGKLVLLFP